MSKEVHEYFRGSYSSAICLATPKAVSNRRKKRTEKCLTCAKAVHPSVNPSKPSTINPAPGTSAKIPVRVMSTSSSTVFVLSRGSSNCTISSTLLDARLAASPTAVHHDRKNWLTAKTHVSKLLDVQRLDTATYRIYCTQHRIPLAPSEGCRLAVMYMYQS